MTSLLVSAFSNISPASTSRIFSVFSQIDGEKTVITTDFNHGKKCYYEIGETNHPNQVNLHVPDYKRNISLKRIWSHLMFARQVKRYLNSLDKKPDTIYCTMPTSSSAYVCAKFCKRYGVNFVIDVIDLWPDSLLPLVKGKAFLKALLYPWTYLTRYAYRHADVIIGESVAYANEANKYNSHAKVYPIYIGVDMNYINKVKSEKPLLLQKSSDEIWIAYAGSLGNSYDFESLLKAVKLLRGKYKYKFLLIGDGEKRSYIESLIKENGLNAEITGYLPHENLLGYLSYCDIAVNIFRKDSKVVYSYKFNDYVAMNCFVLNSLEGETAEMVDKYQIGRNFDFENHPLSQVLEDTLAYWDIYSAWRENSQRLIEEKLDKDKIYSVVKNIFKKE